MEGLDLSQTYDLAVIGGGPAGTSAAITAAQLGLQVLLLEAGTFPRQKVCGEFVSGEACSILEQLFCSDFAFASAPRISKARIFLDGESAELSVSPPALSISRYDLDFALWQKAADAGASVLQKTSVLQVRRIGNYFAISADNCEARSRAVIDASGRWSKLRNVQPGTTEKWLGLKGYFYERTASDSCDLYFFPGGYCGVQPLPDRRVNVAAMVHADIARSLTQVFAQSRDLLVRSRNWSAAGEPLTTAPLFFAQPRTANRQMALAGDAAAFIDPFAGDGISVALHSGKMAALAMVDYLSGHGSLAIALRTYDRQYRALIQPALTNAARLRRMLRLPLPLRRSAISLLRIPLLGRFAVQQTRVRKAS